MFKFKRGTIITKDENLNFYHEEYYQYNGQLNKLEIYAENGVVYFDTTTPHPILLDCYINLLYKNKGKEKEEFGVIKDKIMINGFHTPEINSASFLASQGNVVVLYLEIPEEEKIGSKYEGTGLTRSMMIYMPEDKDFTSLQESYITNLDTNVEVLGVAYAGKSIDDVEVFSGYDARDEMDFLKEDIEDRKNNRR